MRPGVSGAPFGGPIRAENRALIYQSVPNGTELRTFLAPQTARTGERTPLACWFWRPAKTHFVFCPKRGGNAITLSRLFVYTENKLRMQDESMHYRKDKVRAGETPTSAREMRALPGNPQSLQTPNS